MGQCVSSCGSERQVDSVPQTPDSEGLPCLAVKHSSSAGSAAAFSHKFNPDRLFLGRGFGSSPVSLTKIADLPSSRSDSVMNDPIIRNSPKSRNRSCANKTVTFSEPDLKSKKVRKPLISFNRNQVYSKTEQTKSKLLTSNLFPSKLVTKDNIIYIHRPSRPNLSDFADKDKDQHNKDLETENLENSPNGKGLDNYEDINDIKNMGSTFSNSDENRDQRLLTASQKPGPLNITQQLITSGCAATINHKGAGKTNSIDQNGNSTETLKNLNSIREETRLLRERFFSPEPEPIIPLSSDLVAIMNRPNRFGFNRPVTVENKSTGQNVSNVPKLYSVPRITAPTTNSRPHTVPEVSSIIAKSGAEIKGLVSCQVKTRSISNLSAPKFRINPALSRLTPVQPSPIRQNHHEQKNEWKPGTEFFSDGSAGCAGVGNSRRSSEPPKSKCLGSKIGCGVGDEVDSRRLTTAHPIRRIPGPNYNSASNFNSQANRFGLRKPVESKPFYTIGLYQNRLKDPTTHFGVLNSGFQGVSTGVVKERTLQYQSKIGVRPKESVPEVASSSSNIPKPGLVRSATYTKSKDQKTQVQIPDSIKSASDAPIPSDDVPCQKVVNSIESEDVAPVSEEPQTVSVFLEVENYHRRSSRRISIESKEEYGRTAATTETESSEETEILHHNFPIRHDTSGTSASSLGTSSGGHGDHNVISDSEFLIDDEISDQPELTLTFKDSSLILSPSSSGESLLSCDLMLDLKERTFGELTSDSAISDVSSHKPSSVSNADRTSSSALKNNNSNSLLKNCSDGRTTTSRFSQIPNACSTPLSSRLSKSSTSFRAARVQQNQSLNTTLPKPGRNSVTTSQVEVRGSSKGVTGIKSTMVSSSVNRSKTTPEKRPNFLKQNQNRSILTSASTFQNKPAEPLKEVSDVQEASRQTKATEFGDSEKDDAWIEDIKSQLVEMKNHLENLNVILEEQDKKDKEKDDIIKRLTAEIESLKGSDLKSGRIVQNPKIKGDLKCREKDKMANVAVQTDNNYIINKAVTYPEENDKLGQLVSFRIGRFSSSSNKS